MGICINIEYYLLLYIWNVFVRLVDICIYKLNKKIDM